MMLFSALIYSISVMYGSKVLNILISFETDCKRIYVTPHTTDPTFAGETRVLKMLYRGGQGDGLGTRLRQPVVVTPHF
jgi:hypothetical protein